MKLPESWENYGPFLWHGFFLALTMAMIDLNTVLPTLLSTLTGSSVAVGAIYSIMLGAPLLFNLPFSRLQNRHPSKRRFLLVGIYARAVSFLGLAAAIVLWGTANPTMALFLVALFILVFAAAGGFAGLAYTELVGRLIPAPRRPSMYATRQVFSGIASLAGGFFLVWLFKPGSQPFHLNYGIGMAIGAAGLLIGAFGFWRIREAGREPGAAPTPDIRPDPAPRTAPPRRGLFRLLRDDPALLRFVLVENLSGFSLMLLPFYMVFIQARFADAPSWLGVYLLAQTLGAIGSNLAWARVARLFGPRAVTRLCMAAGGVIPVVALLVQPLGPGAFVLLFVLIGFVISGRNIGFEPWLLSIAPAEERTTYLGVRGSLSLLIAFLPLAGGLFIRYAGYELTFLMVAALMLASSLLVPRPEVP
jgi:MFS family permease